MAYGLLVVCGVERYHSRLDVQSPVVTARSARSLQAGVGFGVSALAVLLVARRIDWTAVHDAVAGARLWPWLPLAVAAYLAGQFLRGVRSRYLVGPWADLPPWTAANIVAAGYALNNILPVRLGEFGRAALLADRTGITLPLAVGIVIVERLLDAIAILILFLGGIALAETRSPLADVSGRVAIIVAGVLAAIVVVLVSPGLTRAATIPVARLGSGRLRDGLLRWTSELASGVALLRSPSRLLIATALSLAVWIAETGLYLLLLPAVGLGLRGSVAIIAMGVTNLGILVPSTPGFIGTFHYFASQSLMFFGVAAPTALAYAFIVHLAFFIPITIWGLSVVAFYGAMQWRLAAMSQRAPAVSAADLDTRVATVSVVADAPPDNPQVGALLRSLVESFVPDQELALDPAAHAAVVESTTTFVLGEVRALPVRLRVLFSIGMIGFRVIVRVTTGRGFCELALIDRRRIVDRWAFGPIVPARQWFRVVRSTALLAFWDAPVVRAALASTAANR